MHFKLVIQISAVLIAVAHIRGLQQPQMTSTPSNVELFGTAELNATFALSGNATRQSWIAWIGNILRPSTAPPTTTTTEEPPVIPRECTDCRCGMVNTYRRIVGGKPTKYRAYPWMAMLMRFGRFYCGASLINDRYVATAAHCLRRIPPATITVRLMVHNRRNTTGTIDRQAIWVGIHEKYNSRTVDNDIGLIRLSEPVPMDGELHPVCLPQRDQKFVGEMGIATGWGAISEGGGISEELQEVVVPIMSQDACRKSNYGPDDISDNMLCAGYEEGGKDACQGDSGGPLHVAFNGTKVYQLAGIVSWGEGCARPNSPGVYTRVNRYLDWIGQKTRDGCSCGMETGGGGGDESEESGPEEEEGPEEPGEPEPEAGPEKHEKPLATEQSIPELEIHPEQSISELEIIPEADIQQTFTPNIKDSLMDEEKKPIRENK